jgi:hypothetical protein
MPMPAIMAPFVNEECALTREGKKSEREREREREREI